VTGHTPSIHGIKHKDMADFWQSVPGVSRLRPGELSDQDPDSSDTSSTADGISGNASFPIKSLAHERIEGLVGNQTQYSRGNASATPIMQPIPHTEAGEKANSPKNGPQPGGLFRSVFVSLNRVSSDLIRSAPAKQDEYRADVSKAAPMGGEDSHGDGDHTDGYEQMDLTPPYPVPKKSVLAAATGEEPNSAITAQSSCAKPSGNSEFKEGALIPTTGDFRPKETSPTRGKTLPIRETMANSTQGNLPVIGVPTAHRPPPAFSATALSSTFGTGTTSPAPFRFGGQTTQDAPPDASPFGQGVARPDGPQLHISPGLKRWPPSAAEFESNFEAAQIKDGGKIHLCVMFDFDI
jgi:hypothetical protein